MTFKTERDRESERASERMNHSLHSRC